MPKTNNLAVRKLYSMWCLECDNSFEGNPLIDFCPQCHSPWVSLSESSAKEILGPSIRVTGRTPTLPLTNFSRKYLKGKATIYAKLETCNITGSFKDRGVLAALEFADNGHTPIVIASAGNTAISFAFFHNLFGNAPLHIWVPKNIEKGRLSYLQSFKKIHVHLESSYPKAQSKAKYFAEHNGFIFIPGATSPILRAGLSQIMSEVVESLGCPPSFYVQTTSGGIGMVAAYEFLKANRICDQTRLVVVQSASCCPIVKDFGGKTFGQDVEQGTEIALLDSPEPRSKNIIKQALKETNGLAFAFSENEMAKWENEVFRTDGIKSVDPVATLSLACTPNLLNEISKATDVPTILWICSGQSW